MVTLLPRHALVEQAEAAVRLTAGQLGRAADDAREAQREAFANDDLESASVAEGALGLAAKELGELSTAEAHLTTASDRR